MLEDCRIACAEAPMSSANLGSGFDVASVALDAFSDRVCVKTCPGSGSISTQIVGPYSKDVRGDNTAVGAVKNIISKSGFAGPVSVELRVWKGIPVSMGLGSSGASAAAAAYAASLALNLHLDPIGLVEAAAEGEFFGSGSKHYDNVAASVLGFYVFITSFSPFNVSRIEVRWPEFLLAVPRVEAKGGKTSFMRSVLPSHINLETYVRQLASLTALVLGVTRHDVKLMKLGMNDVVIVPSRSRFVPCFSEVSKAVGEEDGIATISGAGPSIIILPREGESSRELARKVEKAYERCGVEVLVKNTRPTFGVKPLPSSLWDSIA
ncbi:MAG: homoserine kinase [Desulfurococcales archaeon]|nr:homoserine kinase [Desulfurococcales archaeon]